MRKSYVALDLETTGLNPKRDTILEVGAVRVTDGQIEDTYSVFVNTGTVIPPFITELTGIDNDMVKDGLSIRDAMKQLTDFCEGYDLLGHNIMFDFSFIKRNAVNCGLAFDKNGIDTLKIAQKHLAGLPSRKLGELCRYYGIEQERRHRAYDDAVAASRLYECLSGEFETLDAKIFDPVPLVWNVKKEGPITISQKGYLIDLIKYHRIEVEAQIETLTKNEASRMIDKIILQYGKIKR